MLFEATNYLFVIIEYKKRSFWPIEKYDNKSDVIDRFHRPFYRFRYTNLH